MNKTYQVYLLQTQQNGRINATHLATFTEFQASVHGVDGNTQALTYAKNQAAKLNMTTLLVFPDGKVSTHDPRA